MILKGQIVTKREHNTEAKTNKKTGVKYDWTSINGSKWQWKMKRIIFAEFCGEYFARKKGYKKRGRINRLRLEWECLACPPAGWSIKPGISQPQAKPIIGNVIAILHCPLPAGQPSQAFRHHKPSLS
jgi:hypothetical protein